LACGAKLDQVLNQRTGEFPARANPTSTKENQLVPFARDAKSNHVWAKPSAQFRPSFGHAGGCRCHTPAPKAVQGAGRVSVTDD